MTDDGWQMADFGRRKGEEAQGSKLKAQREKLR
jgi:hypothetical protein